MNYSGERHTMKLDGLIEGSNSENAANGQIG